MQDATFPSAWQSPKATINGTYLSFNRAAFALLGEPEAVVVRFEADQQKIMISPATEGDDGAIKVRAPHRTTGRSAPNPTIYIGGFARRHGLATARQRYSVELLGNGLILTPYRERSV